MINHKQWLVVTLVGGNIMASFDSYTEALEWIYSDAPTTKCYIISKEEWEMENE